MSLESLRPWVIPLSIGATLAAGLIVAGTFIVEGPTMGFAKLGIAVGCFGLGWWAARKGRR